jgi:hypothetical protein
MSGYEQGDLLAQQGMDAAVAGADEGWLRAAKQELAALIQSRQPWTTDIVWFRLEALGVETPEPRALGGLIRSAARAGLIVQRGYTPSTRPECHARPVSVWQAAA